MAYRRLLQGRYAQALPNYPLQLVEAFVIAHVRRQEADTVPPRPARTAESAADATHSEAVVVDLKAEAPAQVFADDLVDPGGLRGERLIRQTFREQLSAEQSPVEAADPTGWTTKTLREVQPYYWVNAFE
jgi:hypothetical protein